MACLKMHFNETKNEQATKKYEIEHDNSCGKWKINNVKIEQQHDIVSCDDLN